MSRTPKISPALLAAAIALSFLSAGCFGHKKMAAKTPDSQNAEPDKILYDRALNDYQHGRYTESRLALQTLINSYPDSEYLAKAKLAVADSYYKEGGVEGLTQAVAEYKDFITFFPFLPEAAYAQMQVGMAHYRMIGKPDRDATGASGGTGISDFSRDLSQEPSYSDGGATIARSAGSLGGGRFRRGAFLLCKGR